MQFRFPFNKDSELLYGSQTLGGHITGGTKTDKTLERSNRHAKLREGPVVPLPATSLSSTAGWQHGVCGGKALSQSNAVYQGG